MTPGSADMKSAEPPGASQTDDTCTSMQLLQRAKAGDRVALEVLFARHLPRLSRWAHGRLSRRARDRGDTADVVHDAAMNVFARLDRFEPRHRGALQAYLRQAVLNRIRDEGRRVARSPEIDDLPDEMADKARPSPFEEAASEETRRRYNCALASLTPLEQQAIVGRVEMGYSYDQLALLLDKPSPDAARVMVGRSLVKLSDAMRPPSPRT